MEIRGNHTFKIGLQQLLPVSGIKCICVQQVQAAQEEMVRVDKVVTNGWEVT